MRLQQSSEKQRLFPKLGGPPCDANPGFSEMPSLATADERVSLRGRATKREGGGERPQTGMFTSGTTARTNGDALIFPEIMGLLDRDEIGSGGESKASRDPDLRHSDLDPPLFSATCPSNTDSVLFSKGTTRPDSFLDFDKICPGHGTQLPIHSPSFVEALQPNNNNHNDYIRLPLGTFRKTEIEVDTRSVASSTTIDSTAHTVSIPTSPPTIYQETFFYPTPTPSSSTGPSPTTPQHQFTPPRSRRGESAPIMVPESSEPIDSRLSSSYSNSAGADVMKNKQWRPRSAPKTSNARSASPFQFWGKRSDQPQLADDRRHPDDFFTAAERDSDDATYVDSVSNHLGKMTSPPRPRSSDQNDQKDLLKDSMDAANRGPQPVITREEYESLPQAIQRKVCLRAISLFVCGSTCSARDPRGGGWRGRES